MHWIDPACLPETRGRVSRFLVNPHGDVDGMILDGHLQVHLPPHLGRALTRTVKEGDRIRVRGIKPRGANIIAAVLVTAANGRQILDEGPGHAPAAAAHRRDKPMEASGEVQQPLYGPKGELRGALLTDGTSLRMPPHAADALADYLRPGVHVQIWGRGLSTRHGKTIEVSDIAELVDSTGSTS
ncbi:hypothetical protein M3I53_07370 [Paraburkholderia sp. CNPSo 3272]|uniref:hypothetical protein n=1 Tax=Paraburkholderia sp. CNPSo 3272 TaxID=2940931 RepID=UPI0020B8FFD9|nr:hypothetical protein [Paraburkholderia sp. CNPSo 3272]MCP3722949.1 hypothetical protein [Paraburkholderia sp. CNPSo 3272]